MRLRDLQDEARTWRARNFESQGERMNAYQQLAGMMEELGELAHVFLKTDQKIRGNQDADVARLKMEDCIGDFVIFATGFCDNTGIDLERAVTETWQKVKLRDWVKDPVKGGG